MTAAPLIGQRREALVLHRLRLGRLIFPGEPCAL
jgi:hypothetical protein